MFFAFYNLHSIAEGDLTLVVHKKKTLNCQAALMSLICR